MGLVQKSFSDIITFSRSSNATRVGPTGVLEYAPHNLLTYSEQFDNAAWNKVNATTTANAIAAPNGTVTAELIAASSTSCYAYQAATIGQPTITFSAYAKPGSTDFVAIETYDGTANVRFGFNLVTLATSQQVLVSATNVSASAVSVGNGWVRCSVTFTRTGTSNCTGFIYVSDSISNTSVTNGKYAFFWGAQLSVGPYPLDYVPTTSAAVYGPRFDYDGSGVTIVEPVSTNLLTYSEQFDNAAWTKLASTVTANSTTAPDGTLTADTVTGDGTNASHVVRQSVTLLPNTTYVCSAYAKANTNNFGYLFCGGTGAGGYSTFDYSAGSLGANQGSLVSRSITNAGNGWYRAAIVFTTGGTVGSNFIEFTTSPIDTGSSVVTSGSTFYWGAQLEVGSTATAYMVSGATNGFRAVPVVSGSATPRGLLVEEQRTNLLTYSEQFDNAAWTKAAVAISANSSASPDGTVNADLLYPTSSSAYIGCYQNKTGTVSGTKYSLSVFAKSSGKPFLILGADNNVAYVGWFNISTGSVGTMAAGYSGTISNFGNGWYRCTITWDGAVGRDYPFIGVSDSDGSGSVTASGSNGILIWGAQFESSASFASSYIPTVANTVTRSADVASVNTLSPWFNSTGTLYTELERYASSQNVRGSIFHDGTTSNYIGSSEYTFGGQGGVVVAGGTGQASLGAGSSSLGVRKFAFAFGTNDFALSENGGAVTTDTSGTLPTVTTLGIGSLTSSLVGTGYIRRIAYYPRRLTNAELQALSA